MIANVYLDAFGSVYEGSWSPRIVRYADDILILYSSKSAAVNALEQASRYLEDTLLLTVNLEKTHISHSYKGVKFLGVSIHSVFTRIQEAKVSTFKAKVKALTRRNSPVNLEKVIKDLNPLLRGFANYFRIANCKKSFAVLAGWVRRRLRAIQMSLWKKPKRLHRRLRQLGYRRKFKAIKMNSWANAASPLSHYALPNSYLSEELGLFALERVTTGILVSVQ